MVKNTKNPWYMITRMIERLKMYYDITNRTMSNPEFKHIMDNESFDLVILGLFSNQFIGLGYHFKCPVIVISHIKPIYSSSELVGNPLGIAATSNAFHSYGRPMSFLQRVKNMLITCSEILIINIFRCIDKMYYDSNFPPNKYPSFDEALRNVSLVLVNHHFSQGHIRAHVPAMVEIGGIHIEEERDALPVDIQEFLDSASDGAILFSFGSNVKSSMLPKHKLDAILRAFGGLKQKVLFKWENDDLPNKPHNMMIKKWLPQTDILADKYNKFNAKFYLWFNKISFFVIETLNSL